ncbi:HD domain-containing protein [Litorilinea aerophila]|uniref:HD domain-containing protein n=1 Tax=Litorilinea aerophila TaxID=1204385 RepID=UPI001476F807|nr:HD domain-containing protein [Litorilinea aerophila]MCC9078228.1 HD domain-containing protein [Litorilinea aerophila]GIV80198.1 MAG: hypothetical protein KatS3mg050_4592 [Litorilinea sp.]
MATTADIILTLLDQANHLKQLPRTGWLLAGVADPESVAEHSHATALLALFLAESINADWRAQGLSQPLAVDRVVRLALIHDLAEAVLTDLPRRSSQVLGAAVKQAAERQIFQELLQDLPNGSAYLQLWEEYAAASTPEARLVQDADKLEMVHQALCYQRRGHRHLQEFWEGHRWHYPLSQALFEALDRARG